MNEATFEVLRNCIKAQEELIEAKTKQFELLVNATKENPDAEWTEGAWDSLKSTEEIEKAKKQLDRLNQIYLGA